MPNRKVFGTSVTAPVVRAGGKCWQRLTITDPASPDYTSKQVVNTFSSAGGCAGPSCSDSSWPTMILAVTGSSGTINWCGETWTLPGDSDVEKEVCPSLYHRGIGDKYTTTFYSPPDIVYTPDQHWKINGQLSLARQYFARKAERYLPAQPSWLYQRGVFNTARLTVKGNIDLVFHSLGYSSKRPIPVAFTYALNAKVGLLATGYNPTQVKVNPPTTNSFEITDTSFGSYTDAINGVTYTWRKGEKW
jgi:hypothetical protein